jgi:hypothetical protein
MNKKAQGLSMTTIVVAALALLVLVVLALVFTGRMGSFSTGIKEVGTCAQACTAAGFEGGISTDSSCAEDTEKELIGFMEEAPETCCCKI